MRAQETQLLNQVQLSFDSLAENVALSRLAVACVATRMDISIGSLEEVKVAVSEAVSNAIIHGYQGKPGFKVSMNILLYSDRLQVDVRDEGVGIKDIAAALEDNYSTSPEHMGLGFSFMRSFMDSLDVKSEPGHGTTVTMCKLLNSVE